MNKKRYIKMNRNPQNPPIPPEIENPIENPSPIQNYYDDSLPFEGRRSRREERSSFRHRTTPSSRSRTPHKRDRGHQLDEYSTGVFSPSNNHFSKEEEAYSEFLRVIESVKSIPVYELSQARIMNQILDEVIEVINRHERIISKIQFMNCLLTQQESYARIGYRSAQPIKFLMVFIRLYQDIIVGRMQSPTLLEELQQFFSYVYNNTLSQVKKNPHPAAKGQVRILTSMREECGKIGLTIAYLVNEDEEHQSPREVWNSALLTPQSPLLQSPQTEIFANKGASSSTNSRTVVPASVVEPIGTASHNLTPPPSSQLEDSDEEENFNQFIKQEKDYLGIFRTTRYYLNNRKFGKSVKTIIGTLVDAFKKGHKVGIFRMDHSFFEILLNTKSLNNYGRKVILWTVGEIFSNSENALNFTKTEAEQLKSIIKDFNVVDASECHPKFDTLELLAIRNRFRLSLPSAEQILTAIDDLLPRLIVNKFKRIEFSNVDLKLEVFHPRNRTTLELMGNVVLEEIPLVTMDIVRQCREMQEEIHAEENRKKGPSPQIYCLGPVVKPTPPLVTLHDE